MRRAIAMTGSLIVLALAGCSTSPRAPDRATLVTTPSACAPARMDVYFRDDEAVLTDAARQALSMTAGALQGCDIKRVQVVGLSDARGGAAANQSLSERRALAVVEALEAVGMPAPVFDMVAAGEQGATTQTGATEPLRRRTEIVIEAAPR